MPKIIVMCDHCGAQIEKYPSLVKPRNFCNRTCKSLFQKSLTGESNPNFGKSWSEEKRQDQSLLVAEKMAAMGEESRNALCGSSNRGKKRSHEFIERWHSTQSADGYTRPPKSKETKILIGQKSADKFTPEYMDRIRMVMEERGHWVPLDQKCDWEMYKQESNWVARMWDIVVMPEDFDKVGVFNAYKNQAGYVRDHIFSRYDGFRGGVPPEILRHPANCQIIPHYQNVSKHRKSLLTLEELFSRIQSYGGEWVEHKRCLSLINEYKQGKRWHREYERTRYPQ